MLAPQAPFHLPNTALEPGDNVEIPVTIRWSGSGSTDVSVVMAFREVRFPIDSSDSIY